MKDAIRADHRIMLKMISMSLGGRVDPQPDELDVIARVFCKAGGSWESLFNGAPEDLTKLKNLIKIAFENGVLSKAKAKGANG